MASLAAAVAELGLTSAWLDCEAVVKGSDGLPSFNALQNAFDRRGSESIELYVFDLPFAEGRDLRGLPLRERRAVLEAVFDGRDLPRIHLSGLFDADGASVPASGPQIAIWIFI